MRKELLINEILDKISELNKLGDGKSGSLIITGDTVNMKSLVDARGNMQVLATSFGHQMENNPEFNRLLKSLFGSYLALNTDERVNFIKGLEVTELPFNLN